MRFQSCPQCDGGKDPFGQCETCKGYGELKMDEDVDCLLVRSEHVPAWYVLCDHQGNIVSDACVEGPAREWQEIADALKAGVGGHASFRRCDVYVGVHGAVFCSPRNTQGSYHVVPLSAVPILEKQIRECIAEDPAQGTRS